MMNEHAANLIGSVTGEPGVVTNAVAELIRKLKSGSNEARTQAWLECGPLGAPAIPPLVALWADAGAGLEVKRAARNAVARIVRYAARPDAGEDNTAVVMALHGLVEAEGPFQIRRELLWLLAEIAGDESLPVLRRQLVQEAVREEACMALERIPGKRSLKLLERSLAQSPADFKPVLAAALARRGRKVSGVPSRQLVPTEQTHVHPLSQD